MVRSVYATARMSPLFGSPHLVPVLPPTLTSIPDTGHLATSYTRNSERVNLTLTLRAPAYVGLS